MYDNGRGVSFGDGEHILTSHRSMKLSVSSDLVAVPATIAFSSPEAVHRHRGMGKERPQESHRLHWLWIIMLSNKFTP